MGLIKTLIFVAIIFLVITIAILGFASRNTEPPINPPIDNNKTNNSNNNSNNNYQLTAGDYEFTVSSQGYNRKVFVHVPKSYNFEPTPLVLNFHGGGGSPQGHQTVSQMNSHSDNEGYIVAYPQGMRADLDENRILQRFFNPGTGPQGDFHASETLNNIDDVEFTEQVIAKLEKEFNIDSDRIFATGLSTGGIFSYTLACELSDKISGVASVAGPFWGYEENCNPSKKIPIIHFHGTEDPCAPYNGGESQCESSEAGIQRTFISAQETVEIFKDINSCSDNKEITYQNGDVTCETYTGCEASVTLCTISGGGHTWPGGSSYNIPGLNIGETSNDISANAAMWGVFSS